MASLFAVCPHNCHDDELWQYTGSALLFSSLFLNFSTPCRGRFSLRGSELGWTKSWFMNLGLGEESTAKIKLRMGLNLKSYKVTEKLFSDVDPAIE